MHHQAHEHRTQFPCERSASRWVDQVAAQLVGYCREVHDCRPAELPFDEQLIAVAGWQVFLADPRSPCWSRLDVAALMDAVVDEARQDEAVHNGAIVSLMAFYCYLVKHGHLRQRRAQPVFDQLRPLWLGACTWALEQLMTAPVDRPRFAPAPLLH